MIKVNHTNGQADGILYYEGSAALVSQMVATLD